MAFSYIGTMVEIDEQTVGPLLKNVRLSLGMTLGEFYGPITEHVSNYSSIENGNRKIGKRKLREIIELYNINREYLASGEGQKILSVRPYLLPGRKKNIIQSEEREPVPYYNVNLADIDFSQADIFQEAPEFYVNFRPFNDCNAYLPIYGDSMYPRFSSGEIIVIKEITNYDVIQWGEAYLVVTDERANAMATVKLLFAHSDESKLTLRSSNPNYQGDIVINKSHISKLYIVKGKITRSQL
ncbi:XRE family transcriptional regulator [Olivibacter sitiensis]|uniref:XRE family transcriptional regulator n=1 Tax=Olivibacter sitiensis TaxID=376470 RepID=UPI00041C3C2A|nr:LexA family transcriptional regulator [Olivibacter sitiensis]